MKIAVLSDIHDRTDHLAVVLAALAERHCDRLFFLGDICSPFTLQALAEGFHGPINAVLGNNDGDPLVLARVEAQFENLHLHGDFAELAIDGSKYALTHSPNVARAIALSGLYNAVFYGHTHVAENSQLKNGTLLANPGEIMGRYGKVSCGIYDSETRSFELMEWTLKRPNA